MFRNLLLYLVMLPFSAVAQVNIPARVESVVSGGYWTSNSASGRYRIIIVHNGFEAVASKLFVQWIRDPRGPEFEPEIVATVEPKLPFGDEAISFSATIKPLAIGRVHISIEGVASRDPKRKVRAAVIAMEPGKVAP